MSNDPIAPEPGPGPPSKAPAAPRGVVLCGIAVVVGFIAYHGPSLWSEFASLRQELDESRLAAPIGFVGISPRPSGALPPEDWFQNEGEAHQAQLWAGWHQERGHLWFRMQPGDLDRSELSTSVGRDLFPGIDRPLVEMGSGPISGRIPGHYEVDTFSIDGQDCAYPVLVLDKVLLVNDEVRGQPLLVLYTLESGGGSKVFDPTLDGRRLRMGFAGYFYKRRPLLYERSTEGLWLEEDEGLVSLSGEHRGRVLRRVGRMDRVRWGDWGPRHDDSRILIGADRSDVPVPL